MDYQTFYDQCLEDLKLMHNYSDSFIPMLKRYCTLTCRLSKLMEEILSEEVSVSHTNKAKATNQVTSPKWRMFIALNKEAAALARELRLSPNSAPYLQKTIEPKGTDRFKIFKAG